MWFRTLFCFICSQFDSYYIGPSWNVLSSIPSRFEFES